MLCGPFCPRNLVACVAGACHTVMTCLSLVSIQIREVWNTYELDLVNYQNKCRLIRGWDDLFNKVKEHINSVSAMKLSPYYKVPSSGKLLPYQSFSSPCPAVSTFRLPSLEALYLEREPGSSPGPSLRFLVRLAHVFWE